MKLHLQQQGASILFWMHDHRAGELLPIFLKVPPDMPVPLSTVVTKGPPPHSVRTRAVSPSPSSTHPLRPALPAAHSNEARWGELPLPPSGATGLRAVEGV